MKRLTAVVVTNLRHACRLHIHKLPYSLLLVPEAASFVNITCLHNLLDPGDILPASYLEALLLYLCDLEEVPAPINRLVRRGALLHDLVELVQHGEGLHPRELPRLPELRGALDNCGRSALSSSTLFVLGQQQIGLIYLSANVLGR